MGLGNCGITNLEELPELFECYHLKILDLSSNQISDIRFLEKLTGLKTLDLDNNRISDIRFLEKLTDLQYLDLDNNRISDIRFLEKLTDLQYLYLSSNQISDIRFLEKLTNLQYLYLSSNQISDIHFLEKLTNLQSLYLSSNQISDIRILEKLTNLKTLVLSSNQISDIHFLEKLTNLQSLYLSSNQISDIRILEKLTNLQSLYLKNNQIKKIPESIFQLGMEINMNTYGYGKSGLALYDNPIELPPLEIIKQGKQSVLNWFTATKVKLNEIKIILIGDAEAGKTSLLRRLSDDSFDEKEGQTDGVNIENIEFGMCEPFSRQKSLHDITGHFWDFGGQEIMNATHQLFLTKRSIYVLVLAARKDKNIDRQIREWVKQITATGGESPIIVLANKMDINSGFGFANESKLQEEFPQIKCFIKISCKTGDNIESFKEELAELILTEMQSRTEIDVRWVRIKEQLQKETKSEKYLNERRFKEICNEARLTEEDGQKNAIDFLHDLGTILHFEKLKRNNFFVLDPTWITYGAYRILTSELAGKNYGEVSIDDLDYIVNKEEKKEKKYKSSNRPEREYYYDERQFLVDILHEFKLCFRVKDSHFIIPDLLDTKEPLDIITQIESSDECIRFVYRYEYLPSFIMPNIMVEMHDNIKNMWRTGCVLYYDDNIAIVSRYDRVVTIISTGKDFMSVIRHKIDLINKALPKPPLKLIPLPGINDFVLYEKLLAMEKAGEFEYKHDEYLPTEKTFNIKKLLEGIEEEPLIQMVKSIRKDTKRIPIIERNTNEILAKLDSYYDYLLSRLGNSITKEEIQEAINECNDKQKTEIIEEITPELDNLYDKMDNRLKEIYNDLKQTDDLKVKLKLSIPLIKLLGIDFVTEFDVKSLAQKMYKKYKVNLFNRFF